MGDLAVPLGPHTWRSTLRSAQTAVAAADAVLAGSRVAYALCRPSGHHARPDRASGFCYVNNSAIAAARLRTKHAKVAVLDVDTHHGDGTQEAFYRRADVLTVSIHTDPTSYYPFFTGYADETGSGAGEGHNLNLPLPPGCGEVAYLHAMERVVLPALHRFRPEVIVVACGFDAAAVDPLGRMLCTAETFRRMTRAVMHAADASCGGKLVLVHEGGYSEVYVPFCGHAVLEELSGSRATAPDPMAEALTIRQPGPRFDAFAGAWIDDLARALA
jgi:acetoin utilization deacetylase AcuC-like enzyme